MININKARAALAEYIGIISGLISILSVQALNYCPDIETKLIWTSVFVLILIYFTTYRGLIKRIHLSLKIAKRHANDEIGCEWVSRRRYLEAKINAYFLGGSANKSIVWLQFLSSLPFFAIICFFTPWETVFDFLNTNFRTTHTIFFQNEPQEIPVVLFESPLVKLLFIAASYGLILLLCVKSAENIFDVEQLDLYDE
ncbi:MAG: hypothetical protein ACHWZW_23695 [Spirulina sp.]